jgi:hypothetical protein
VVTVRRFANGSSREKALELASKINFQLRQKDTVLYVNNFVGFSNKEKFRNQLIEITIAVPKNKRIVVDESAAGWGINEHFDFGRNWNYNYQSDNDERNYEYDFERGVEYVMTAAGKIKRTHPRMEDNENSENDDNNTVKPENRSKDDSVYHFKPGGKTQKAPVKPATPKTDTVPAKRAQTGVGARNITAIPAMFIERFTI